MKNEYFKTNNNLQLLREWATGADYIKNEQRAKEAAARLFYSGVLVFEHGEKPRTAAEFIAACPYTSSGDFAAIWARCNWQIMNKKHPRMRLDGIALTDAEAVAIWTTYDENGDEIATEYAII